MRENPLDDELAGNGRRVGDEATVALLGRGGGAVQ